MNKIAVITGDIINSGEISKKKELIKAQKKTFSEIKKVIADDVTFEIFRGDSFQGKVVTPKLAVRIALIIKSGLIKNTITSSKNKRIPSNELWDARVSVGIGQEGFSANKIIESEGEAFALSGRKLDLIKNTSNTLVISSVDEKFNNEFLVLTKLVDSVISKWSEKSAEIVYRALLFNETQKQMAEVLKISQSAVNKRFAAANYESIKMFVNYSEKRITELCQL